MATMMFGLHGHRPHVETAERIERAWRWCAQIAMGVAVFRRIAREAREGGVSADRALGPSGREEHRGNGSRGRALSENVMTR
jgi:hypothetical protein